MKTCWRDIAAAGNSYAALRAACSVHGISLHPVRAPSADITCYSLNSVTARKYETRDQGSGVHNHRGWPLFVRMLPRGVAHMQIMLLLVKVNIPCQHYFTILWILK